MRIRRCQKLRTGTNIEKVIENGNLVGKVLIRVRITEEEVLQALTLVRIFTMKLG